MIISISLSFFFDIDFPPLPLQVNHSRLIFFIFIFKYIIFYFFLNHITMDYLMGEFNCFERYENLRFYLLKMIVIMYNLLFFFKLSFINGAKTMMLKKTTICTILVKVMKAIEVINSYAWRYNQI